MKIVLTFDSFEEFLEQINRYNVKYKQRKQELIPVEDVAAALKAEEAKKTASVDHAALNESAKKATEIINKAEAKEEPAPEVEPATVTEDFRAEVRHVLHELNKQKNSKTAATDIIKTFGVTRLTDVPLSDLPALMTKAQEALNA